MEDLWSLILVAPALFALLACAAGAQRADVFRPDWEGDRRTLASHRLALPMLFTVSLVPLYAYCAVLLFGVIDLVACGPDAYECPL